MQALQEKNQSASTALSTVEDGMKVIGRQLLELRPLLPPRLSDALELSFRSLAGNDITRANACRSP